MKDLSPQRVICLTEETTETLYILGQQDKIVGISGFTVRPKIARKEKPKISTFLEANEEKIEALNPDLILGFSDIQADIAFKLIKKGYNVYIFNHRSVQEILKMVWQMGALTNTLDKANDWIGEMNTKIRTLQSKKRTIKPIVYFEEWGDPIFTGIQWVAELIEIAGGTYCYPEHAHESLGKNRIVANPLDVVEKKPDIIIGSWCGKQFKKDKVIARDRWDEIPAVQTNDIYEIKSAIILQPGPAALTDGLDQLVEIIDGWTQRSCEV